MTANVEAMEGDAGSLLEHYRRLIHLRAASAALGSGDLVPLRADRDGVVAYLRRAGDEVAVVVANLGHEPQAGATLTSEPGALEVGRYVPELLEGEGAGAPLEIGADGAVRGWAAVQALEPRRAYVFQLVDAEDAR
jgi:glycosidase